jgi:hypothetical protein
MLVGYVCISIVLYSCISNQADLGDILRPPNRSCVDYTTCRNGRIGHVSFGGRKVVTGKSYTNLSKVTINRRKDCVSGRASGRYIRTSKLSLDSLGSGEK